MFPLIYIFNDWSILILRIAIGAIFVVHGWPKLKNLKKTAEGFGAMGFKPGFFWGPLIAFLEFFGGIGLILGLFTQIFAALFAIEFVVAAAQRIFFIKMAFVDGWEFDVLILAVNLLILSQGAGMFSLDRYLLGIL